MICNIGDIVKQYDRTSPYRYRIFIILDDKFARIIYDNINVSDDIVVLKSCFAENEQWGWKILSDDEAMVELI